jgi:hypothetical protein
MTSNTEIAGRGARERGRGEKERGIGRNRETSSSLKFGECNPAVVFLSSFPIPRYTKLAGTCVPSLKLASACVPGNESRMRAMRWTHLSAKQAGSSLKPSNPRPSNPPPATRNPQSALSPPHLLSKVGKVFAAHRRRRLLHFVSPNLRFPCRIRLSVYRCACACA